MKKRFMFLLSAIIITANLTGCTAAAPKEDTTLNYSTITNLKTEAGSFAVYDYGKVKLHVYSTNDPLNDQAFIVEGKDSLIGIELPSFTKNLDMWKGYIKSLNKPMNDIFISSHPAGASYIQGMNVYGTEETEKSINGGAVGATTQGLYQAFGSDFHGGADTAQLNKIIPAGKIIIDDIEFNVINRGDTYDLEIPSLNLIYTHMLGKTVHSIITSKENLDSMVAVLKEYQDAGYEMILTSHFAPEGQDAVTEKIAYLKKIKELSNEYQTPEEFISAVKAAFPNYIGENYLEMTAGYLYK